MTNTTTIADAEYVHHEWDRRARAHNVSGLLDLYTPDAVLESPLVPRIMNATSGVVTGHERLREFFERGTQERPNELVRFYRTGQFLFHDGRLVWEYPRVTPDGDQVDITEVMDLVGPKILHHRIYWGWFGTPLLQRDAT